MTKYRVGIVGLRRGETFADVFSAHPRVEVTALCDIDEGTLTETAQAFCLSDEQLFTQFEDFVNAPMDIVMIGTPIGFHAQQTIAALESGKHVLCEQTAAYTLEDCERVVNTVKRTGKTYMMAENYCYFHYLRQWQKLIQAGKIGDIFYAEAEYIHEIVDLIIDKKTGTYFWRHERPPIWYCAHSLGPLLMLMGDRILRATGVHSGFRQFPEQTAHPAFLDMEVGLFQTKKGAVIKILRSQTPVRPHLIFYELYGTKGCLESPRNGDTSLLYLEKDSGKGEFDTGTASWSDPDAPQDAQEGGHGTSEYFLIREFLDSLEEERRPEIDVIRSMDFTVPGLIAHESALRGGEWMDVPLFDW